jgi:hypothetical protein
MTHQLVQIEILSENLYPIRRINLDKTVEKIYYIKNNKNKNFKLYTSVTLDEHRKNLTLGSTYKIINNTKRPLKFLISSFKTGK